MSKCTRRGFFGIGLAGLFVAKSERFKGNENLDPTSYRIRIKVGGMSLDCDDPVMLTTEVTPDGTQTRAWKMMKIT